LTKGGTVPIVNRAWSIFTTFVFITFTRLFFRSGSNLDPATANKEAWETAQNMVAQIGGHWNWSLIGQIVTQYYSIFVLFAIGMIIHWLPERWKRWYRYNFACLPLPLIAIAVVVFVFILYQFNIADFQAFIYFQF
ncbi:MAG: MBOAT family protein, partial [Bacteroidales bacterium]|nr:MBOAT family protein [Bacteroidales bacterium]